MTPSVARGSPLRAGEHDAPFSSTSRRSGADAAKKTLLLDLLGVQGEPEHLICGADLTCSELEGARQPAWSPTITSLRPSRHRARSEVSWISAAGKRMTDQAAITNAGRWQLHRKHRVNKDVELVRASFTVNWCERMPFSSTVDCTRKSSHNYRVLSKFLCTSGAIAQDEIVI